MSRRKSSKWLWWVIAVVVFFSLWIYVGSRVPYLEPTSKTEPLPSDVYVKLAAGSPETILYGNTFPMANGIKTAEGYPIFEFTCDVVTTVCVDYHEQPIAQIDEAATRLPPVRYSSMEAGTAVCVLGLCYDERGRLIGSDPRNFDER